LDKIRREANNKRYFRLVRGIYETNINAEPAFLAGVILSPSYLSFEWALSYYGLIPERVFAITSASLGSRKNKTYENAFGRFEYSDIPADAFSSGLLFMSQDGYYAKVATAEKALCDALYKWPVVKNVQELEELLFEDKRIDEVAFDSLDAALIRRLAPLYHAKNLGLLVKYLERKKRDEFPS
jgi:predicted transcriptional regulator of viral defense system